MKKVIYLLVVLSLLHSSLFAGTTGKISGKIKDAKTGEPLFGASIVIKGTSLGATTDLDGYYSILNITPGVYEVVASYIGYSSINKQNVQVNADRTTYANFDLITTEIGMATIEVTAKKDAVIRDLTSTFSVMQSEQIKTLPVENIGDLLQLQAGITKDANGGVHMRGGRSSEIQYYIDGMAVSNPFSGGLAVGVQNNSIQELQVISGTFNAEYGKAMSGIVNIITKEGNNKTEASFSAYSGDFLTTKKDIFLNIDKIDPFSQQYIEGSLSGPVPFLDDKLFYFISGRFRDEENWLYGQRRYMPGDTTNFLGNDPEKWTIQQTGDNAIVPMNPSREISTQLKLSYRPAGGIKMALNVIMDKSKSKSYSHADKFNPEYLRTSYRDGINTLFTITHAISKEYFQEFKFSYYWNHLSIKSSDNPYDPIFAIGIQRSRTFPSNIFNVGGIDPNFLERYNNTFAFKYELTGQVDKYNMVKVGAEYRQYQLQEEFIRVLRDQSTNWQITVADLNTTAHNYYLKKPFEFAAYIQDKIEIEDLIVNVGVRLDYFNSKSKYPVDMLDPHNDRQLNESELYKESSPKIQISPRFGLAFPISDKGNIHVSYGQFFQIPDFDRLYENPEFEVTGSRFTSYLGNANLDAQRTTVYEIGLQQQVSENLVLNATCFFKDYRNLTGTKLFETYYALGYGQYTNADFGNVWGATIAFDLLKTGLISATLDYTYQVADGNGSDPREAFDNARNEDEASKSLVPLNWDQRHVLNSTITLDDRDWGISFINRLSSGLPYNPTTTFLPISNVQLHNEGRYKPEFSIDFKLYKRVQIFGVLSTFFISVENLLDATRIDRIPTIPERELETHMPLSRFNSLYDYLMNPARQPRPRLVKIGFNINL